MKTPPPKRDDEREERIATEIIVDAYGPWEVRSSWYCHLEDALTFSFEAKCVRIHKSSSLKRGEQVTVLGMVDDDGPDGLGEMQVRVRWQGRTLVVPLSQLEEIRVGERSAEAIADWHYWVAQGRLF